MKKNELSILLAAALFTLSGCGDANQQKSSNPEETSTTESPVAVQEQIAASEESDNASWTWGDMALQYALANEKGTQLMIIKQPIGGTEANVEHPQLFTQVAYKNQFHKIQYLKYQNIEGENEGIRDNFNHFGEITGWVYECNSLNPDDAIFESLLLCNDAFTQKYNTATIQSLNKTLTDQQEAAFESKFGQKVKVGKQVCELKSNQGSLGTFCNVVFEVKNNTILSVNALITPDQQIICEELKDNTEGWEEEELTAFYEAAAEDSGHVLGAFVSKENPQTIIIDLEENSSENVNNSLLIVKSGKAFRPEQPQIGRYVME